MLPIKMEDWKKDLMNDINLVAAVDDHVFRCLFLGHFLIFCHLIILINTDINIIKLNK